MLRLAGAGTAAYIDRRAEEHNAKVAAAAGVDAEVLFFDGGPAPCWRATSTVHKP